ncbi:MAG: hypothetical protein K2W88_15655, partial [Pararheinheimera sp.]|nr:hypothetical protein [Rheinheimera sp.]
MNISVKNTLLTHTIVVAILLITPIVALHWVSAEGSRAINKTNDIYSKVLLQLTNIDGALNNARFHGYAGFMHDETLEVSKFHTHPFELHLNTVKSELDRAEQGWETILQVGPDKTIAV